MNKHLILSFGMIAFPLAFSAALILAHGIFSRGFRSAHEISSSVFGSNSFVFKDIIYAKAEALVGVIILFLAFLFRLFQFLLPANYIYRFKDNLIGKIGVSSILLLLLFSVYFFSIKIAKHFGYKKFVSLTFGKWKGIAFKNSLMYHNNGAHDFEIENNKIPNDEELSKRLETVYRTIEKIERLFELESTGEYSSRIQSIEDYFDIKISL